MPDRQNQGNLRSTAAARKSGMVDTAATIRAVACHVCREEVEVHRHMVDVAAGQAWPCSSSASFPPCAAPSLGSSDVNRSRSDAAWLTDEVATSDESLTVTKAFLRLALARNLKKTSLDGFSESDIIVLCSGFRT